MSANIPFEIQEEIIKRILPVKSLIRFRSVSKQWKSLIDSPEFITHHSVNQNHPPHLLVKYRRGSVSNDKYVSIVDDDSFPRHKFSHTVKQASFARMLDSSHGLVCFNIVTRDQKKTMNEIIVWNPSIKRSVRIQSPGLIEALGFGVCPKTGDPKILKITRTSLYGDWNAEVFRLSFMSWTSVPINLPRRSIRFLYNQVVVDGVVYWNGHGCNPRRNQIITFDLTSEEFGEIKLPQSLAASRYVYVSKLKECVVVLDGYNLDARLDECDVWMMLKNDDSKFLFTKIFTVDISDRILGFRKNGQRIIDIGKLGSNLARGLEVYDPCSERYSMLGIYGTDFSITSYTESLFLLNHPDSIIE